MTMIRVAGLSFAYGAQQSLFDSFTHAFAPAAATAIVGPSGRGKSTLLFMLGLMLTPVRGLIEIDGVAADRLSDSARARMRAERYGFVFQDASLDGSRTILENVLEASLYRSPRADDRTRALSLLERFGVESQAAARPMEVSGGQAQRISLCRALLNNPDIVLADEPTGNLDETSGAIVTDALLEHAHEGATVVIVTHNPRLADQCDELVSL